MKIKNIKQGQYVVCSDPEHCGAHHKPGTIGTITEASGADSYMVVAADCSYWFCCRSCLSPIIGGVFINIPTGEIVVPLVYHCDGLYECQVDNKETAILDCADFYYLGAM